MKSLLIGTLFLLSVCYTYAADDLVIVTTKGPIEGKLVTNFNGKNVTAFLGVPFAKPPIGELRFKPPVEPSPWKETIKTVEKPIACYQDSSLGSISQTKRDWWIILENETSEDCLYLNVWVPNPRPANASVMVWIHGGAFELGSSNSEKFQGQLLAAEQDVIVVSMNYRLNIFGHLYLENVYDGNAGLQDQALALKWVKKNIALFGGNPDSVTIMGVSAGGASVGYHLILPTSQNLFNRAIIMSGTTIAPWAYSTKESAITKYNALADIAKCPSKDAKGIADCFNKMNTTELGRLGKQAPKGAAVFAFTPVVDGVYLPNTPVAMMASGFIDKTKEIIIGETENEGAMFMILFKFLNNTEDSYLTSEGFGFLIKSFLGNDLLTELVQYEYTNWNDPNNPVEIRQQATDFLSDTFFVCGLNAMADLAAANGNKVYQYLFSHRMSTSLFPKWAKAVHSDEQDFFFGWPLDSANGFTPEEVDVTKKFMKLYGNFAKTGNPNSEGEKEGWPLYNSVEKPYLDFDKDPEVKHKKRAHHCAFWNSLVPDLLKALGQIQTPKC